MSLFTLALILFLIMDPVGNLSSYLTMVKDIEPKRQRWIVIREMLIVLTAMIVFNYIGETLFDLLQLEESTVRLSSGVILFLIAIKILFPASDSMRSNIPKGEPFIFPLAIPLIAGPSLLATIMLFAHLEPSQAIMLEAIFISWFTALLVLLFARPIKSILGVNGLLACEKLMGMILVLIAVQRFLEGIVTFVQDKI